ncbi:MAG: hypothetical protein AAF745_12880 [Planctomycetota bacterium]
MKCSIRTLTVALVVGMMLDLTLASVAVSNDLESLLGDWTVDASKQAAKTPFANNSPANNSISNNPTTTQNLALPPDPYPHSLSVQSFNSAPANVNAAPQRDQTLANHQDMSHQAHTHQPVAQQGYASFEQSHGHHNTTPLPPVASQAPLQSNPYAESCATCGTASCDASPSAGQSCDGGACDAQACDSGCGCQSGCGCSPCGELLEGCDVAHLCLPECRPHRRPSLPPPSTFLQYFNSRNSYSTIWDGYNNETRHRLRNRSPYVVGPQACRPDDCDCF